jgi:hypothetical protein
MRQIIFLILSLLLVKLSDAQDILYKYKGNAINVQIVNSTLDSISYRLLYSLDTGIYTISKNDIKKIIYSNGRVETFEIATKSADKNNTKSILFKINPLSPLFGHTQIGIEKQLKSNSSFEFTLSFIGAGVRIGNPSNLYSGQYQLPAYKNQLGGSFGLGYRLYLNNPTIKKKHPALGGLYIKPTIYGGAFGYNAYYFGQFSNIMKERYTAVFGSAMLEVGVQVVVTKNFHVDFYSGVGYSFDNLKTTLAEYYDDPAIWGNLYTVQRLSQSPPGVALSGGVKLGWKFTKKGIKKN